MSQGPFAKLFLSEFAANDQLQNSVVTQSCGTGWPVSVISSRKEQPKSKLSPKYSLTSPIRESDVPSEWRKHPPPKYSLPSPPPHLFQSRETEKRKMEDILDDLRIQVAQLQSNAG